MFGVMIDTSPKFYTVSSPPPYITLRSRSQVFRTSLFPNPMMDLVHIWCDDRYWSTILHSAISTSIHHFKVKVTDLELLCQSLALKFFVLEPHCFQTLLRIWFMFGVMIDAGPKFYVV